MQQSIENIVSENYSLFFNNTFGVHAEARYFLGFKSINAIEEILLDRKYLNCPVMVLGSGSNILFTQNFDGIVFKPENKGIEIITEDDLSVDLKVGAGELWDDFTAFCVTQNWCGIENLSGIPGTVGACPVQNIGAYGAEVKDYITEVEVFEISTHKILLLSNSDCKFDYRNSIFKNEFKNKFIIVNVTFRLSKTLIFNTSYNDIEIELNSIGEKNLQNIRTAILNIRKKKLPDPAISGNAGSFFKNPVVTIDIVESIKKEYPDVPLYHISDKEFKIPAGWLIEQCGWKGKRIGNVGIHNKQALVLVNYGNATGEDILDLAEKIIDSVKEKFNIELIKEVNIV